MAIQLNLSLKDKQAINHRYTSRGHIGCQVCGATFGNIKDIAYHFMEPSLDVKSKDQQNIVPVCKKHKSALKDLSVHEYRSLAQMEDFFSKKRVRKLNDVLALKLGSQNYQKPVKADFDQNQKIIRIALNQKQFTLPVSECPSTGYHYFYIVIPANYIHNDSTLQPRPLEMKRMWALYRHLLLHSQLTPSICRLVEDRIMLFDGQHKTAAQIWAQRNDIECKVYIDPRVEVLKETNLVAHDALRQMPFFSSVLINKWADLFSDQWEAYMHEKGPKSEAGFLSFLGKKGRKRAEALNMLVSNIYDSILEDGQNQFLQYIAEYNQGQDIITLGKLKQNILKKFICRPPLDMDIEDSDRLREQERKNMIRLLNKLAALTASHDPQTVQSLYLKGALKAWSLLLKESICQVLGLYDDVERARVFLRPVHDGDWETIEQKMERLFSHRVWSDHRSRVVQELKNSRKDEALDFLKSRGLSVNWVLSDSGARVNVHHFID